MNRVSVIQNFIIIACRNKRLKLSRAVNTKINHNLLSFMYVSVLGLLLFLHHAADGQNRLQMKPLQEEIYRIVADESFQPLIETEVYTFTHLYTDATIKPVYKPEYDVINDFMNDSVKVIVTSKKLTDYQIQYLRDTQIIARTTTYAYDALALITNHENNDTLIKIQFG